VNKDLQGGPKKVRPLRSMAHIFCLRLQNARANFRYFGTLQCHFILNTSVDSKLIKFIVQSGATCQNLTTQISLATTANNCLQIKLPTSAKFAAVMVFKTTVDGL